MKQNTEPTEPKLQPPGAGLPLIQRLMLRFFVGPVVSKRVPPAVSRARYESLNRKLIDRIAEIPAEKRAIRVLVDPMAGLEDSSRYWSLNGILEHLLIVSSSIEGVILSLSAGQIPDGKADTATVKPKNPTQDALPEFLERAPAFMKRLDERLAQPGMNLDSPLRFEHPWFGPMKARQWYWLLERHQVIHYQQAKRIIQGLNAS